MISAPIHNEYSPDLVSHPVATLQEVLEDRGITQADLAERMGRPKKTINELVMGKAAFTPETALQLERVLGVPASFWNNLETNYRAHLAAERDRTELEAHGQWLQSLPLTQMINLGWIKRFSERTTQVQELLQFFGVASKEQWTKVYAEPQAAFRRSAKFETDAKSLACWLRKGAIEAQRLSCAEYDRTRFRSALSDARRLSREPIGSAIPTLVQLFAQSGVALVLVPQLKKLPVSGATQWVSTSCALIQLSFRYKTDDHFWFTLFHEAGHILLHGKRLVFLEGDSHDGDEEHEANKFAADMLIPATAYRKLRVAKRFSKPNLEHFAQQIGIAPGIVVGRLQHDGALPHTHCNDLKESYDWEALVDSLSQR